MEEGVDYPIIGHCLRMDKHPPHGYIPPGYDGELIFLCAGTPRVVIDIEMARVDRELRPHGKD
jgi:hypothetical protein